MSKPAGYHTSDANSFAYTSARQRWPVILTKVIDDVHKAISKETGEKQTEGKALVADIAKLNYECQHNRALSPIPHDGGSHFAEYNAHLETLDNPSWSNAPWLFTECYLYRRLYSIFSLTNHWKRYDPFEKEKTDTFRSSRTAVLELAKRYNDLVQELAAHDAENLSSKDAEAAERVVFHEMCRISLWGNATDLSLLTNLSFEELQSRQGSASIEAAEKNIIVNDLDEAFDALYAAKTTGNKAIRRVDIVLDNAGFELYVDLILACYLIHAGLATQVVIHPKDIPWFVSDVTPSDFSNLLNSILNAEGFYNTPSADEVATGVKPTPLTADDAQTMSTLASNWMEAHAPGGLVIRPHAYWTRETGFWNMPEAAPDLYNDLKESELVIFKGDLNYRKLTEDAMWPRTTPFATALGPLGAKDSGLRVLSLRTCKADVVVGLSEGLDERLREENGQRKEDKASEWTRTGKYAVVQFCNGQ